MVSLYDRLRAVACVAWGIPPWELQAAIDAESVDMCDVIQASLVLGVMSPLGGLLQYLYHERAQATKIEIEQEARARREASQLAGLVARAKPKNDEEALRQAEILQAINQSG